jgi:SHAQKYF class myb-like DNA-binding protein
MQQNGAISMFRGLSWPYWSHVLSFSGPLDAQPERLAVATVSDVPHDAGQHGSAKPLHKPRVVWTDELHQRFLRAIEAAGSEEAAVPTVILKVRYRPLITDGFEL